MLAETGNLTEIVFSLFLGPEKSEKKTRNISKQNILRNYVEKYGH